MGNINFSNTYHQNHQERFDKTLNFIRNSISKEDRILDIGPKNPFSTILQSKGYDITNTELGLDLDYNYDIVTKPEYNVITAFEILEHLVSPFPLLHHSKAKKLFASIPLKLWFASAYWNENDPFDRHYHEFEPRQFDMLLNKAGWKIINSEKWVSKSTKIGVRPLLRCFFPRYYIVYCERESS